MPSAALPDQDNLLSDQSVPHWTAHTARWTAVGGPLRPCAEDLTLMRQALGPCSAGHGLIIGSTPDLTALSRTNVTVDHCAIRLPPAEISHNAVRTAVLGDWRALPEFQRQFDFAIGDGSLICLRLAEYKIALAEIGAVLTPGSPIVLRVFMRLDQGETLDAVQAAAAAGQIGSFHAFKWRLAMALCAERQTAELAVRDIFDAFTNLFPDRQALAALTSWPVEAIDTIDSYAESAAIYSYPTRAELTATCAAAGWSIAAITHGTYELAERCPIVTLRGPKADATDAVDTDMSPPSQVDGTRWPQLLRGPSAQIFTLMRQLEAQQWQPPDALAAGQLMQFASLAAHAGVQSPAFSLRLRQAGLQTSDLNSWSGFQRLPLLTRRDIQAAGESLFCTAVPQAHGAVRTTQTSGATGEPVVVRRTDLAHHYFTALTMRDHYWHKRDFSGTLAISRATTPLYAAFPNWGQPVNLFHPSGPLFTTRLDRDIAEQAAWLQRVDPHYVTTYPTSLAALLDWFAARQLTLPQLREVRTVGETVTPALRARIAKQWGVPIVDSYSSQELGLIALQCPDADLYHTMDENLIVEVLRDDDSPCSTGEIGRIVVTDLHNFATPLIRYEIGDYAERGPPCPCGRALGTLRRIMGRSRHLLRLPDGRQHWPLVGFHRYREIAPAITQYQLVQLDLATIELRLAVTAPITPAQETLLADTVRTHLNHDFDIRLVYHQDRLPMPVSGKFEEFISLVTNP